MTMCVDTLPTVYAHQLLYSTFIKSIYIFLGVTDLLRVKIWPFYLTVRSEGIHKQSIELTASQSTLRPEFLLYSPPPKKKKNCLEVDDDFVQTRTVSLLGIYV